MIEEDILQMHGQIQLLMKEQTSYNSFPLYNMITMYRFEYHMNFSCESFMT